MKLVPKIDLEKCIGDAVCEAMCPDVFEMADDDKAHVINPDGCGELCDCEEAAEACPTEAIILEEVEEE
ncbi:ferredoxin [candidate division WOR-3 bacterium]|nr:ferredoxin [candidate division WOR-3 bacterium]TET79137.1 MAG: ferredoxin [Candidatus Cloacimonadota bacterium]